MAAHSGYFTVRQFLDFAHARSGKRNARFVEKLFTLGHATAQRYTRRSLVYHLRSRRIFEAIGNAHLRNRREHELDYIKIRLLALDFILANPEDRFSVQPKNGVMSPRTQLRKRNSHDGSMERRELFSLRSR
ncbi:MAG: hypothetical protein WB869_17465 [Candidatus Acidiferrales bacterium]